MLHGGSACGWLRYHDRYNCVCVTLRDAGSVARSASLSPAVMGRTVAHCTPLPFLRQTPHLSTAASDCVPPSRWEWLTNGWHAGQVVQSEARAVCEAVKYRVRRGHHNSQTITVGSAGLLHVARCRPDWSVKTLVCPVTVWPARHSDHGSSTQRSCIVAPLYDEATVRTDITRRTCR